MRISLLSASLLALVVSAGCSKDGAPSNPGDDDGSGSEDAAVDAPDTVLTGESHELTFPDKVLQPGEESTQCVWVRLPNTTEIKIANFHNRLSSASHHLIVYKDDQNTTEQATPVNCQPFAGALNPSGRIAPIMITQRADDPLELPDSVGYTFDAHQMIKLEMHYLNATDEPITASAKVEFFVADPATITQEADILFIGSPDISMSAGEQMTLKQFFKVPSYLDLSESNIFAITGHTHHLGTDMNVRVGNAKDDPAMREVYNPVPFRWAEPETTRHDPPFAIPTGGGFEFECSYTNTTTGNVGFGESANDEMCFFWAYYYPSQGSKVCIHTEQYGGANGINVCCPGDQLCSLIEDYFE